METIVSLNNSNFPGFQEGSVFTNTTLSSGSSSNCAILDDGNVTCWGWNYYGQLGDGTTTNQNSPIQPWSPSVGRTAVSVSFGGSHMCTLLDDGKVSCLGFNLFGQIGDGSNNNKNTPTTTSSFGAGRKAIQISSGQHHTCAILDDGTVSCWGYNWYGQLGDGTNGNSANKNTPTQTSSLGAGRTAIAISSGQSHTCALLDNGSVTCWGDNTDGQIGDGTNSNRNSPVQTSTFGIGRTAVAISSGNSHTCALLDDKSVSCWGNNGNGRLGDGTTTKRNTPTLTSAFGTGRTVIAVSSGGYHSCALLDDQSVSCWGDNSNGQLGDGTTNNRYTPTPISSFGAGKSSIGISLGTAHTCSLLDDTSVSCWGDGSHGEIGDGTMNNRNSPTQTSSFAVGRTVAVAERDVNGNGILNIFDTNTSNNSSVIDTDGDGVEDSIDAFPNDANETSDTDGDGVGDNADQFPNDANETSDTDGDGVGDNADQFPNDANETSDSDGDGIGDNFDQFPQDASESIDSDGDGVGDNSDQFPSDASESVDSDGDGVGDNADQFPNDANESIDSDGDGVGDIADQFPNDANESMDSDGDGVGDNADQFPDDAVESIDSDGDGVGDTSDALPFNPNETMDSDGDGTGDNSDLFPNDSTEQLDSDSDGIGDNSDLCLNSQVDVQVDSDGCEVSDTKSNENQNNSNTTVLDLTCLQNDFDCDFILDSEDTDLDGDGIIDELFDDDKTSTSTDNLHKMIVKKTSTGFEIEIRFEMLTYPSFASQVSWVSMYYENGTEREAPLIWDFSLSDGTFKMGVPNENMTQLEQTMCQHPMGSPEYSTFDMFEWLENSINLNGASIAPSSIDCSWKNKPSYVDLNVLTGQIESADFLMNMHEEHELLVYKIKIETRDDAQNITIAPIWAVNQSAMLSANYKAFNVENNVDNVDDIWYWWSQNYSAPLDLSGASIEDESGASNGGGSGSVGIVIVLFLGVLLIQRRKKKKIKKQMKKIAKQQIKEEKEAKKLAKLEKKNKSNQQADSTDESVPETMEELAPQTPPPKPPMAPPKPSQDASGVIGDDGYEWITFPPNSQNHFYRVPGEREWSPWDG